MTILLTAAILGLSAIAIKVVSDKKKPLKATVEAKKRS